jgi:hypothetical protein
MASNQFSTPDPLFPAMYGSSTSLIGELFAFFVPHQQLPEDPR